MAAHSSADTDTSPTPGDPEALAPIITGRSRLAYLWALLAFGVTFIGWFASISHDTGVPLLSHLERLIPNEYFLNSKMEPDSPVVVRWATDIKQLTSNPFLQASLALSTVERNVVYGSDMRVWGVYEYVATPTEMEAKRIQQGWRDIHDDCDGSAVMLVSLLQRLGFNARAVHGPSSKIDGETMLHAWCEVDIAGRTGTLLSLNSNLRMADLRILRRQPGAGPILDRLGLRRWEERERDSPYEPAEPATRVWPLVLITLALGAFLVVWDRLTRRTHQARREQCDGLCRWPVSEDGQQQRQYAIRE